MFLRNIRQYLLFLFMLEQCKIHYASTSWPSLNTSGVQLLGLFPDMENTSTPTTLSVHSQAMFKAAILLSQRYGIKIQEDYIGWQIAQTGGNVVQALNSICQILNNSTIVGVVGPAYSREARDIAGFGEETGIPVVSYAVTDPDLSDRNAYPTFYRTAYSDNAAALAIAKLFLQFNWTSSIIIYQNDAFGSGGAKIINEAFATVGISVRQMIIFDIATQAIRGDLRNLLTTSAARIIILWADPVYTPKVIQIALKNDVVGPQFTWISSSPIALNAFNQTFYPKLVGMLTVEPVTGSVVQAPINTTLLNAAFNLWKEYEPETYVEIEAVDYYALFAFDATWSLILSLQQLYSAYPSSSISLTNTSCCFDCRLIDSSLLLDVMNNISFLGVSGPVQFSTNTTDRINGTYYIIQNCQLSANSINLIPVMKYSDFNGWDEYTVGNVIVWPGNSLTPPSDRPITKDVTLRIAVIEAVPYTMLTYEIDDLGRNTTKFIGFIPDMISRLQYNMKFIPQFIVAPSTQTYNQIIQGVANGLYDMVVGDVTVTAARRQIVSFSTSFFDNSIRILIRKSNDDSIALFSYLNTFSLNLWLMILVTCIVAALLISLLERQENEALQNRSWISLFAMGMWYSLGVLVGYGVDFHVRTAAGRLLTVGMYMISLVFVATYTANLASYLTTAKATNIISGIDDLKNGKIPFNRIGIRVGTSVEAFYLREISNGVKNYYAVALRKQQYEGLINNLFDATLMDTGVAEYGVNNLYCDLTLVGTDYDRSAFGIVMPKQWIYAQEIDINILALRESGVLDDLRTKWFQSKTCPAASNSPTAMRAESMGGLFLTFGVISLLSLFFFIWKSRFMIRNFLSHLLRQNILTGHQNVTAPRHSITICNNAPNVHSNALVIEEI